MINNLWTLKELTKKYEVNSNHLFDFILSAERNYFMAGIGVSLFGISFTAVYSFLISLSCLSIERYISTLALQSASAKNGCANNSLLEGRCFGSFMRHWFKKD